jgi:hypothetical protein
MLALLATIGAGGEFWRYVLLLESRDMALSARVVGISDALVTADSLLAFGFSFVPIGLSVWWLFVARTVVLTERSEIPARSVSQVVIAFVVPVFNFFAAGCVVAELEHTAFNRLPDQRPRPSRLLLSWWALWVLNWVLLVIVIVMRIQGGLQAEADGVLLTGLLDLSAAGLAAVTALLLHRLTRLLAPVDSARIKFWQVLRVSGAPKPELRPQRRAGATR